jgi:flagellar hook-associated protein 1 FlgK
VNKYYDQLSIVLGGEDNQYSPSALLGSLGDAIDLAAANPSNSNALPSVAERARDLADALNTSYSQVLSLKQDADKAAGESVDNINSLLASIKQVNDEIVQGTQAGRDVFDAMDKRDGLVSQLSEEIGITVRQRANNDIAIYTSSGLTLFDTVPRAVEFQQTALYGPNTTGNALYIDGVAATGPDAVLPVTDGRVVGYLQVRDNILTEQQQRIDELARGLVDAFAETDQTGGGKPPLAGLFTWSGGPAVPASGTLEQGIALSIALNPAVDPGAGGNPTLLRDGGVNGDADYVSNTTGAASYSDLLLHLSAGISQARAFDGAAGLVAQGGLDTFADAFVGAFEQARSDASNSLSYQSEMQARLKASLQSETGPNLDYEMSQLLEVEKAYQASAKLIAAADELFATLLNAVG